MFGGMPKLNIYIYIYLVVYLFIYLNLGLTFGVADTGCYCYWPSLPTWSLGASWSFPRPTPGALAWSPVGTSKWRWQLDHRRILIAQHLLGSLLGFPSDPNLCQLQEVCGFLGAFILLGHWPKFQRLPLDLSQKHIKTSRTSPAHLLIAHHTWGFGTFHCFPHIDGVTTAHDCRHQRRIHWNSGTPFMIIYVWCLIKTTILRNLRCLQTAKNQAWWWLPFVKLT